MLLRCKLRVVLVLSSGRLIKSSISRSCSRSSNSLWTSTWLGFIKVMSRSLTLKQFQRFFRLPRDKWLWFYYRKPALCQLLFWHGWVPLLQILPSHLATLKIRLLLLLLSTAIRWGHTHCQLSGLRFKPLSWSTEKLLHKPLLTLLSSPLNSVWQFQFVLVEQ